MPFEIGGRADKLGNHYEKNWLVHLMCQLLDNSLKSVMCEPLGNDEIGVDFWATDSHGIRTCYQCKARNASSETWSLSDLHSRGVLKNIAYQLGRNETNHFILVSAATCLILRDMGTMARNSELDGRGYYENQVCKQSQKFRRDFEYLCKCFGLNHQKDKDLEVIKDYLSRLDLISFSDDIYSEYQIHSQIQRFFIDDSQNVYRLLSSYIEENSRMGCEISNFEIRQYLKSQGIVERMAYNPQDAYATIQRINDNFNNVFQAINESLLPRKEVDECIEAILSGESFIFHGSAGCGKSGCIQNVISILENKSVPYIAVKLDKYAPKKSANHFGQDLGLPYSPVFALSDIAVDKPACIILDQLDAIRWTAATSRTAVEVCNELFRQLENVNSDREFKISCILACRTFDLDNDAGIKSLFKKTQHAKNSWERISISNLSSETVANIVGARYGQLHKKTKELLAKPSNLFIWTKLGLESQSVNTTTTGSLIDNWWKQICRTAEDLYVDVDTIVRLRNHIVDTMQSTGNLSIPLFALEAYSPTHLELLTSLGLLYSDGQRISFAHQSFFDYFLVKKSFENIAFAKTNVIDELPCFSQQNPALRFRLQLLLERLFEFSFNEFFKQGLLLIKSEQVRFYYKHVFLEVLSSIEISREDASRVTKYFYEDTEWESAFWRIVVLGNSTFVSATIDDGYLAQWMKSQNDKEKALETLRSVSDEMPDVVVHILNEYFECATIDAREVYWVMGPGIDTDSDSMFAFRLHLIENHSETIHPYISIDRWIEKCPTRAVELIKLLLNLCHLVKERKQKLPIDIYVDENKKVSRLALLEPEIIVQEILPMIAEQTKNTEQYSLNDDWSSEYTEIRLPRFCVNLVISALVNSQQEREWAFCNYQDNKSIILKEIFLSVIEQLPDECADSALRYLLGDFEHNIWDYTSNEKNDLSKAQHVIRKFSPLCSDEIFKELENEIISFKDIREWDLVKRRSQWNTYERKLEGNTGDFWFYPHWGYIQKALLPCMKSTRLSRKSLDLIAVLERNDSLSISRFQRINGHSGFVTSVLSKKEHLLSDKQWKQLITPPFKDTRWSDRWEGGGFYSSSPHDISRSLDKAVSNNPKRFANLALSISEDIPSFFVASIVSGFQYGIDNISGEFIVDMPLVEQFIDKFRNQFEDTQVAIQFCRSVEKRSKDEWGENALSMLIHIAKEHPEPSADIDKDDSYDSDSDIGNSLFTRSINCARGTAVHAIGALLWNPNPNEMLLDSIESLLKDSHPAIQTAVLYCLIPLYNINQDYSCKLFVELVQKNTYILTAPDAWGLVIRSYDRDELRKTICNKVNELFLMDNKHCAETGATFITAIYIYRGCHDFGCIFENLCEWNKNQTAGIVRHLVYSFCEGIERGKCKDYLITEIINNENVDSYMLMRLFKDEGLVFPEDEDLAKAILSKSNLALCFNIFMEYVSEHDIDIYTLRDILVDAGQNIEQGVQEHSHRFFHRLDEFVQAVVLLMDRSFNDEAVMTSCLDLWDILFKKGTGNTHALTKALNDI